MPRLHLLVGRRSDAALTREATGLVPAGAPAARTATAAPERPAAPIVLVLGMHRSGTSALAGLLMRLGGEGPRDAIGANAGNPLGHFEPRRTVALHDAFLALDGHCWSDWSRIESHALEGPQAAIWMDRLAAAMRADFSGDRPMIVKDPRLCRLVPLWRGVAERLGVGLRVILPYRHPAEVAASLARRDGIPHKAAALAWLRHVVDAERDTRDLPRVIISYDDLLADWRREVGRVAAGLGIPFMTSGVAGIQADSFVAPTLRHESSAGADGEAPVLPGWLAEAVGALNDLGRDPFDRRAMQRLSALDDGVGPHEHALLDASHSAAMWSLREARRDPMRFVRARLRARITLWASRGGEFRWRATGRALAFAQGVRGHA